MHLVFPLQQSLRNAMIDYFHRNEERPYADTTQTMIMNTLDTPARLANLTTTDNTQPQLNPDQIGDYPADGTDVNVTQC